MCQYSATFLTCDDKLGMENGDIPNKNIKASSKYGPNYPAQYARLNGEKGGWFAAQEDNQPWIQADIGYQTYVSGVVTEGFVGNYPTSFKVSTFLSSDDEELFVKSASGEIKVNFNSNTSKGNRSVGSVVRHDTNLNHNPNPYTIRSLYLPLLYPYPNPNPTSYPNHDPNPEPKHNPLFYILSIEK